MSVKTKKFAALFILLCLFTTTYGQSLSLKECVIIAVVENLRIQQGQNTIALADLNLLEKKLAFLPSAAISTSVSKSFGKSVDNFSQRIADSPWNVNPSLGASLTVFAGFSKWNQLKAASYDLQAAGLSLEDIRNEIRLNAVTAFFQVKFAEENLEIAQKRFDLVSGQLESAETKQKAGMITEGDVATIKAQLATEKVNVVTLENQYGSTMLSLKLLLNMDPSEKITLADPEIEEIGEPAAENVESLYLSALSYNPAIRKTEIELQRDHYLINASKSGLYPTLSLRYGFGSFYSSGNQPIDSISMSAEGFVYYYGDPVPFWDQIRDSKNQNMFLSLNIPIFNNYSVRKSIGTGLINYESKKLNYEIQKQELYRTIQSAWFDYQAAKSQLAAREEQIISLQQGFEYAEQKYNNGLIDFYTFMEVMNNKTRAEIEKIQAEYDLILKGKILELYQGNELKF